MNIKLTNPSLDTYLDLIKKNITDTKFRVYRGQDQRYFININNVNSESVYPSVYRPRDSNSDCVDYEAKIFFEYLKDYAKGCSFDDVLSIQDILIEMAQKGKHTRLLDVTTNPLIALFNACDKINGKDGVVYIFIENKDFLNEHTEATRYNKDSPSYLHSTLVCLIKNFYLDLIRCSQNSDIHMMLVNFFFSEKISNLMGGNSDFARINDLLLESKNFLNVCKIGSQPTISNIFNFLNSIEDPVPSDLSTYVNTLNNHLSRLHPKFKITYENDEYFFLPIFLNILSMIGNPVLISPNFHRHEPIIANRILTQRSKILLFPNKFIFPNTGTMPTELVSMKNNDYANSLLSISVSSSIKEELIYKLKRIYNLSEFYPDALNNIY